MSKSSHFSPPPSPKETRNGWILAVIVTVVLPLALPPVNELLGVPLSAAKMNFILYCIQFAATVFVFRNYLSDAFRLALRRLFPVIWYAALGYLGANALSSILMRLMAYFVPPFANVNDQTLVLMMEQEPLLSVAVVLLVPMAEECLFRGLIFRNLYSKNVWAAYLISMAAFSAVHVIGYVNVLTPVQILASFVQYLPAGYCLAWCYRQTGTIATPILMHSLVNAVSVYYMVR